MFNLDEIRLNKNIPTPLYYQLKQQLLKKILSKELQINEQIPNEIDMVEALNISRSTVRQAISELVSDGYLYRIKAKGTFVSMPKVDENFFQKLDSFNNEMIQKGMKPSTEVLAFKKIKGREIVNKALNIPFNDELIYLNRLRYANDQPVVYVETFLPYEKFSGILKEDLSTNSLYTLIEMQYNVRVSRAKREIQAVSVKTKDKELLNINSNAAICSVRTIAYDNYDNPIEYSNARYRGDTNRFIVELIRNK